MKRLSLLAVVAILILVGLTVPAMVQAQEQLDDITTSELILKTDHVKISKSDQFKIYLAELISRKPDATEAQQEMIQYLEDYVAVLDGNFDQAQVKLSRLFDESKHAYTKVRIKATLANIQAISRQYDQALENLDYALEHVSSVDDQAATNRVNLVSSIVYSLMEIYDMSIKYAELVISANPDAKLLCKASVYKMRGEFMLNQLISEDEVIKNINECKKQQEFVYSSLLELNWVNLELDNAGQAQDQERLGYLLNRIKALESSVEKFGYNNLIGMKDMALAKVYDLQKNTEQAILSAQKAIDGSAQSGNTSQVVDAMNILVNDAIDRGDFQKAYELTSKINVIENEIYNQSKAKQMAYMSAKHDNLAKQIEIQQLKQNNHLLALENELAEESNKNQKLLMMLVISLLCLLGLWAYKLKKRHDYFKEVSEVDHLTQVFTRKAFEEKLRAMLHRNHESQEPVNLAILDLDHFKRVNDMYGHLVGDWVLRHVVKACQHITGDKALLARLGGEEFCLVIEGISEPDMFAVLDQIRNDIEHMDCSPSGSDFNITSSFGFTTTEISGYRMSMLLTHADLALFEAKNRGRNLVVGFAEINPGLKVVNLA